MIGQKISNAFPLFKQSVSNSYSQIFFARHELMGILLMLVTLFDLYAGISGLIAVVVANIAAYLSGLSRQQIISGLYGFNPLLVGLGLGVYYQPGLSFYLVLVFVSLLTLLVTVSLGGILFKYGLPYLSLPFLVGIWVVTISAREITHLEISERGIFTLNEMYSLGGMPLLQTYEFFNDLEWALPVKAYFRSLGAIFFQYHLFAGLIIAAGLLTWSRIAFLFSVAGFVSAYLFYNLIGIHITELSYSYIGFNFILTSIAIGAFFTIPSGYSLLWALVSIPLLAFLSLAGSSVLWIFQLPVFSLPFNIVVLLLLYLLRTRERFHSKPALVLFQQFSPEKNLYSSVVNQRRLAHLAKFPLRLPFWGKWLVTQAVDGKHTHKNAWKYAWDFEMTDDDGKTYSDKGLKTENYYCFGKPVLAPADGYISELEDGIPDNDIGDVNLQSNWGNSIVIFHTAGLFSQLSHLKKESITVQKGQFVKAGEQIAACGNSGRSPYPHLHLQFQAAAEIGSPTLDYPFSSFITYKNDKPTFRSSTQPSLNQIVAPVQVHDLAVKAFHFVPGQELKWENAENPALTESWTVETNVFNESCLVCSKTSAKAWFVRSADLFMFTHFEGDRNSLLFEFYLGAYQIVSGLTPGLTLNESITISVYHNRFLRLLQDFTAPFYRFLSVQYSQVQGGMKNSLSQSFVNLKSTVVFSAFGHIKLSKTYEITLSENQISSFTCMEGNQIKRYNHAN